MRCPVCGGNNIEKIEDGYRCKDCGYSETPIGWNHPQSVMWYYRNNKEKIDKIIKNRETAKSLSPYSEE